MTASGRLKSGGAPETLDIMLHGFHNIMNHGVGSATDLSHTEFARWPTLALGVATNDRSGKMSGQFKDDQKTVLHSAFSGRDKTRPGDVLIDLENSTKSNLKEESQ